MCQLIDKICVIKAIYWLLKTKGGKYKKFKNCACD